MMTGGSNTARPMRFGSVVLLGGRFRHGGNPLLRWCFANVRPDTDAAGNIKFNKSKNPELKIDGAVAVAMGVGVALAEPPPEARPYYETSSEGLLILGV
jgi:phage terminase large subunit-like protein